MNNEEFLKIIENSFLVSLKTHSRSNEKLKVLHGAIATDLNRMLGSDYQVKSLGFNEGKEAQITGRYMDKNVDITIKHKNQAILGIAVKFVMSNYSQNSNNYFENMLGETANIRSNNIPYYQIFIVPEELPYYQSEGKISRWETITKGNVEKYLNLSKDNTEMFLHTPNKTLFYVVDIGITDEIKNQVHTRQSFKEYFLNKNKLNFKNSNKKINFSNNIIYNDYQKFVQKIYHHILSL